MGCSENLILPENVRLSIIRGLHKTFSTAMHTSSEEGKKRSEGFLVKISVQPYWQYTQSREHTLLSTGIKLTSMDRPKRRDNIGP